MISIDSEIKECGKTPSQRLRGVLYRLYEQTNDLGQDYTFEMYYKDKMNELIEHFKRKLNP